MTSTLQNLPGYVKDISHVWRSYPAIRSWAGGNLTRPISLPVDYWLKESGLESAPPRSISLRPTFRCNARCQMCTYANSIDPDTLAPITSGYDMLDLDTACRVATELAPYHTMISVTGGEPFIWGQQLFAFLAHCRKIGVPTTVTTNGTFLSKNIDNLLANPPDVLIVSVHGMSKTHDRIVGLPAFRLINDGLTQLLRMKERDPYRPPLVATNTAISMENARELAGVVIHAKRWGAVACNFQFLWFRTEEMHEAERAADGQFDERFAQHCFLVDSCSPELLRKSLDVLREYGRDQQILVNIYPNLDQSEIDVYFNDPQQPIRRQRAYCAWLVGQVMPDGAVTCCLGYDMGNLADQSFMEIWNGSKMKAFRARLHREKLLPICTRCCQVWRNF